MMTDSVVTTGALPDGADDWGAWVGLGFGQIEVCVGSGEGKSWPGADLCVCLPRDSGRSRGLLTPT